MFAIFKKHRILKLVGIAFGLFLLWYLLSPMADMIRGQDLTNEEIIGSYIYGSSQYVEIYTVKIGKMVSEGTTPRQLTDLIGSLCDLTSGSGDKGTPVVLVQGYFDNYTN